MAEIDYTTIAVITALNTLVAIVVKECFDLFKEWRARLREEIRKRNGGKAMNEQEHPVEELMRK
jgi:hypothetical protein